MDRLNALLSEGRAQGLFSHASLAVVRDEVVLFEGEAGGATIFDVASLTKVITATLAVDNLPLEQHVEWLEGTPTIADLLAHRSGLPAWRPLFVVAAKALSASPAELIADAALQQEAREIYRRELTRTRAGAPRPTYSDLGFMALGFALEEATGTRLDVLGGRLFASVGLQDTRWGGQAPKAPRTGDTRPRPWLPETVDLGASTSGDHAVDDDNAAAVGGVVGHAGVWSTARDLAVLGDVLRRSTGPRERLFLPAGGGRTWGVDTPTGDMPSIGSVLGRGPLGAAGHLGFTGCSLWIDRDASLSIALLTNAACFERPAGRLRPWRREVHDVVARAFG